MTENQLQETLASNIKYYRNGKFTQEMLAEKTGVSYQAINAFEGMRRFPSPNTLVKLADALNVEVYQLFIPQDTTPVLIEPTPENERIRAQLTDEIVEEIRHGVNKMLDKIEKSTIC